MQALIKFLEQQPEAHEFMRPVDFATLGLVDYPLVIKQPMDISTVKKKLRSSKYQSIADALTDLQLVWDNCRTYNVIDSVISKQPISIQAEAMERHITSYLAQRSLSQPKPKKKRPRDTVPEPKTYEQITYEDKVELSERVRRVSQETMAQIVQLVQKECPAAYEEVEDERIHVMVDRIDRDTFIKINE
jgi:hypothetical protein